MPRSKLPSQVLRREIPLSLLPAFAPLVAIARNCGLGVTGTRGIGKSTLLAVFAWIDAIFFDYPLIVIDPIGSIIARFMTFLSGFREVDQRAIWQKIIYLNMSSDTALLPTPIYYQTGIGKEDAYDISQRFPDFIARLDPVLKSAGVYGLNPLRRISRNAGAILWTVGLQATEMGDLLENYATGFWQQKLDQAIAKDPSISHAVAFFRPGGTFDRFGPREREARTDTLKTKLALLEPPAMRAQFGASRPGLDLVDVVRTKRIVFIDVSTEHSEELRQFKMVWVFMMLMDFFRRFGAVYGQSRQYPLSLIIDEITFMTAQGKTGENPLVQDLDELINRLSRNYSIQCLFSFQEPYQIEDKKLLKSLLSLATFYFGRFSDPDSARLIADRTIPYEPRKVKFTHVSVSGGREPVTNERPEFFSLQEQIELGRQQFDGLRRLEFLVSRTVKEGDQPLPLQHFSLKPFTGMVDVKPDVAVVAEARRRLAARDGRPIGEVLTEITVRSGETVPPSLPARRTSALPVPAREPLE